MSEWEEFISGSIVDHENYGRGKVIDAGEHFLKINFVKGGTMEVSKRSAAMLTLISNTEPDVLDMNSDELKSILRSVIEEYSDISKPIELGERWKGGKMILQPANPSLKSKEIPLETFFHKIVMVRDRLRVLEQNINSNDKLTDEDKVGLQQYITRIYGSLTTFNILFADQEDQFVGEKKGSE